MALNNRILNVILSMPNGDVTLDASLNLKVKIHKAALAIQNRATIEVIGLTGSLRESLLSQFTAWNQRQVTTGQANQNWINVEVQAGYQSSQSSAAGGAAAQPSSIFKGQVVICELTSTPPNVGFRIVCFSRQIDRTTFITDRPAANITFKEYVTWAAGQMGIGSNFDCKTSFDNVILSNPARSMLVVSAILIDIQSMYRPDVAAYVDDNFMVVKDRSKILNPSQIANISQFIGIPTWTEWGVSFTTLFDQSIKLAQGAALKSLMNPSLNNTYVIMELEYDLASRDTPFYVKASGSPPAA